MGKLTLLFVLAALVGGSVLTMNTRGSLREWTRQQSDEQAGVVAREIAESGRSVAVSRMMGAGGFVDPGLSGPQPYEGGAFSVHVDSLTSRRATLSVTGTYGGASHTLHSTYEFDPLQVPGPVWLDVPYATAVTAYGARIEGAPDAPEVRLDRRKYDALRLSSFLPFSDLRTSLNGAFVTARNRLDVPSGGAWAGSSGLLEDLNVDDTEGLYQAALASLDAGDTVLGGPLTVSGAETWGGPDRVTLVRGDLTVEGRVSGSGALVVRGSLRVPASGRLEWDGLVIVRDTTDVLTIDLRGGVDIEGALAVAHDALPPGGHLDVTVNQNARGMTSSAPWGDISARVSPWDADTYPWHQHTHAFDITPVGAERGPHVVFREGRAAGRHEAETQFDALVRSLGDEEVYLEFANVQNHGFARVRLDVDGFAPFAGTVRTGFEGVAAASSDHRTETFEARDLRALDVHVSSLRALRQAFDTDPACSAWPLCVGVAWDRRGALAMRLVRASDRRRLYEASFYWHMRADEKAAHDAEEAAWRAKIEAGMAFGTHLSLGPRARLRLDTGGLLALADKMGFDGNEIVHMASSAAHREVGETSASAAPPPASVVCHRAGLSLTSTPVATLAAYLLHIGHGDVPGPCP